MSEAARRRYSTALGYLLAQCATPLKLPSKQPTAYLYGHIARDDETPTHTINGVDYVGTKQPDIYVAYTPELQKKYPYALMESPLITSADMYCSSVPLYLQKEEKNSVGTFRTFCAKEAGECIIIYRNIATVKPQNDFKLSDVGVMTFEANEGVCRTLTDTIAFFRWANYNVRKIEDNSIWLPESERIPIYE